MVTGRGGMGSHKHGVSGHNGPSPKQKNVISRQANQELKEQQTRKEKRRKADLYPTVQDAIKGKK